MRLRSRRPDPAGGGGVAPTPSRRLRRRWPLAAGAIVLVLAVTIGAFVARRGDDAEASATEDVESAEQLVEVTSGSVSETVAGEGTIEPETTSDLAFGSSGTVTAVAVAVGDTVAAGDAVATIDSAELEADRAEAQATADDAVAALSDADSDATDAELAALEARVATANLALLEAQQAVDGATLTAPVAGTVTVVDYAVGDVLGSTGADGSSQSGSGTPSGAQIPSSGEDTSQEGATASTGIRIVSTGTYTVGIDVPVADIDQVVVGQEALVTPTTSSSSATDGGFGPGGGFPVGGMPPGMFGTDSDGTSEEATASGDQVSGTVTEVAAVADTSSGVAAFPVEVTVEGSPDAFFPGAVAEVEVVVSQREDVIQVPAFAVTTTDGTSTVTVAEGDAREERTVEVGETSGTMVEITSGLAVGEQVVVTLPGRPDADGGSGGLPGGLMSGGAAPGGGPGGAPGAAGEGEG